MTAAASPIGLRRLYHQRVTHSTFADAGEVAAWFGALQGQDYGGTKWAFGLRLPGSSEAAIEQAIAQRRIIRTWALRGTLFYVAAADIHWLLNLVAPRLISGNALR
ncbi:MAG: winged helix DNA-binding domain-containing protein [Chloroflexi bacterium]|nr:winged helix DNA-binding domain-containing protein [Chloroflexota bacterium]